MDHHSTSKKPKPKTNYTVPSNTDCKSKTTKLMSRSNQTAPSKNTDVNTDAGAAYGWQTPFSIDDEDLTFDGKPLNMLYEENRWMAEHRGEPRDKAGYVIAARCDGARHEGNRGRSRQSRK